MRAVCDPSAAASSTAVTVTRCATSQFAVVNVSVVGAVVTCVPAVIVTVTDAVGWLVRTTSYAAEAPPSVTATVVGATDTAATSSSAMLAVTPLTGSLSNRTSELDGACVTRPTCDPSATASSTAVTVTVRGTSQFADVNVSVVGRASS